MNLRELINRLEEISENGKNDDMEVIYDNNGWDFVVVKDIFVFKDLNKIEIQ